jgi:drug/metabolite transporter (DMT)-like permease
MTVTYLVPVFANVFGVLFLDETVTLWMMGCGVVIVLGTAMASGLVQRRA